MANALNPSIILAGQGLDVVGAMDAGAIAGQRANQFKQQNALNAYLQHNGAQVMNGDQNALNGLAGFGMDGLNAAQGVQSNRLGMDQTRLGMDATRQNMQLATSQEGRLSRQEERQIAEHASTMSREQRAQEAAQIEQAVAQGLATTSPEQWDAVVGQVSPDLVGQFDNREVIAGRYMSIADVLKRSDELNAPQTTNYVAPGDPTMGLSPDQAYNFESGPEGMRATAIGGGGTVVNNNMGEATGEFQKASDKAQADMFGALVNEGMALPTKIAQIDQLDSLLAESPAGAEAAFKTFLGNYGVQTAGLDKLQAARAIISQLVPQQRPPGSGTMSDGDLALFIASLPQLINTPEGNREITQTIRGIAVYQQKQAEIANRTINGEITPAQGRQELMTLENPLQVARRDGPTAIGGYTIQEVQ